MIARFGEKLVSVVIFGSVARGEAKTNSNIDDLLICEESEKSMGRTD